MGKARKPSREANDDVDYASDVDIIAMTVRRGSDYTKRDLHSTGEPSATRSVCRSLAFL